jgi:hypothetical protein
MLAGLALLASCMAKNENLKKKKVLTAEKKAPGSHGS